MKRISTILFVLLSLSVSAQKRGDITIALLTDLHVTPETTNDTKADEIIDEINRSDFDLVVVAGDITNTGSNTELQNIRRKLGRIRHRCIATTGNHETTWSESADTEFRRLWGHDGCTTAKAGDYLFVAYPAGPYMKMADGGIRTETLAWVDREMSKANGRKIVSVCHYPLNNDLTNREEIISIVRKHNAIASLCGHYHKPRLMNFDSIPGILGRSLSLGKKGEENFGYTVIRFANDSIYVSEKRLGEPAIAQYAGSAGIQRRTGSHKVRPETCAYRFRRHESRTYRRRRGFDIHQCHRRWRHNLLRQLRRQGKSIRFQGETRPLGTAFPRPDLLVADTARRQNHSRQRIRQSVRARCRQRKNRMAQPRLRYDDRRPG